MTLKEKFQEFTRQKSWQKYNYDALKCEIIADDYAIDFAKWVQFHSELWIKYRTSELLEIFKQEKGL